MQTAKIENRKSLPRLACIFKSPEAFLLFAHSICSSFELLADESFNLSQAEKKITVVKAEQIYKMTTIFAIFTDNF